MDYRTDSFARRFRTAKPHLASGNIQSLVSLKFRDQPVNSSEYSHFIDGHLRHDLDLDVSRLEGDFGGQAWLVTDKIQNRAIVVEHETGLEILGAIGSIASLIALVPLISSAWANVRHRIFRHRFDVPNVEAIEVRRFDQNELLVEQRVPSVEVYVLNTMLQDYALLKQKVGRLEAQIENIEKQSRSKEKLAPQPQRKKKKKKSRRKS